MEEKKTTPQPKFAEDQLKELIERRLNLVVKAKDLPQPELLIPVKNAWPTSFRETLKFSEFVVLSPVNPTFPTKGVITITWIPGDIMYDPQSLKAYLDSFKFATLFHYEVPALIAYTLYETARPKSVYVKGEFTIDGNFGVDIDTYLPLDAKGSVYGGLQ